ncbi:MAG: glycoside hydrolase family 9 protein [Cytophagaceae bacterium]|nr:glycoside hydrolase family 9 protein [Cytophagaceae bacterium]
MIKKIGPILLILTGLISNSYSQVSENIRINQIGFYANGPKMAIVVNSDAQQFYVIGADKKDTVFSGFLKSAGTWEYSEEKCSKADFSTVKKPGSYYLLVPGVGQSYNFDITDLPHHLVGKASLKAFYYQRASTELLPEHAGIFARKAGHMDTAVLVHNSAATATRPEGTKISSSRGWYDAGDYNKYIVNSGISTYTMLALYEHFPKFCDTLMLNIPESKNNIPDILDESLWNLRWMLTMQDPEDGGVYHKLTNPGFDGSVMPEKATNPRYVVKKSTNATLDFCAVMAQSSRIFKKFNKELPGFADSCKTAALKAYKWAKKNQGVEYRQSELMKPKIETGEYGDNKFGDEFQWAAIELFITTGDADYYEEANLEYTLKNAFALPSWQTVNTLGLYSLVFHKSKFAPEVLVHNEATQEQLLKMANELRDHSKVSSYGVPMGQDQGNFNWGSNSFAANQGMLLIQAYILTKDKSYLDAAIASLDYLLGRNATGFSFVTGYGEKSTRNPHHRPSEGDKIDDPVPGFLAGGPNPGQQDKPHCPGVEYPSSLPAKSYLDHRCSYASNEIAINWNAPFAYLVFAIEAIKGK